jgi:hypothetical protein
VLAHGGEQRGAACAHELRPLAGVEELLVEAGPGDLVVGYRLDEQGLGLAAQPGQVLAGQLRLLAGAHLRGGRDDAERPGVPAGDVLAAELVRVEPVNRYRGVDGGLDAEHRPDREDVDDPAVAPG